jgi:hypothetical protein
MAEAGLGTAPPRIIGASRPTVLVQLDGPPVLRGTGKGLVQRVVNTSYSFLYDMKSKKFYLQGGGDWWEAASIPGSLAFTDQVPEDVQSAAAGIGSSQALAPNQTGSVSERPDVIVATEPTEIVVMEGQGELAFIDDTNLMYLMNSEDDAFVDSSAQRIYLLLAGRWYTATSKLGPWSYIPSKDLPEDFRKIAPDFERPHVLASVSGRDEAHFARLNTFIPETAAINRKTATLDVVYSGEPLFIPVEKTGIEFATNTPFQVLKVEGRYLCCHDGVWFDAGSPKGPWSVCTSRPSTIDTLPPTCPLYPVKFVQVYDATEETAYVGYTPGYLGCYVLDDAVVYGTGYGNQQSQSSSYAPRQLTFGFAAAYDSWLGLWGFRQPPPGSPTWLPAEIESLEIKDPLRDYNHPWWGVNGFRRFGTTEGGTEEAVTDLGLGHKERESLYGRHPDWLAKESWGRHLARRVESTPPTPTPAPISSQPQVASEEDSQQAADARWEALKRMSEAEATLRESEEASAADDYYSDSEGVVYRKGGAGWEQAGQPGGNQVVESPKDEQRDKDLDRHRSARKKGGKRRSDMIHSSSSLSRGGGFDRHMAEQGMGRYRDVYDYLGFVELPVGDW